MNFKYGSIKTLILLLYSYFHTAFCPISCHDGLTWGSKIMEQSPISHVSYKIQKINILFPTYWKIVPDILLNQLGCHSHQSQEGWDCTDSLGAGALQNYMDITWWAESGVNVGKWSQCPLIPFQSGQWFFTLLPWRIFFLITTETKQCFPKISRLFSDCLSLQYHPNRTTLPC